MNYVDPSGNDSWQDIEDIKNLISEYLKEGVDLYGLIIGYHYLYGGGKEYTKKTYDHFFDLINHKFSWKLYLENNDILTGKVGDVVIPIGTNLDRNESIQIDMTFSMIIQNGEGATGYAFMHGTNQEVGGFQIKGTISKDKKGTVEYDLVYTWNDKMDPFPEMYNSDARKAEIAKKVPFAHPADYIFRISWADKTVIYQEETFFNRNQGWLKDWDQDWVSKLSEDDSALYISIDDEQVSDDFKFMRWKDYVKVIMELYSEYYDC